MGRDLQDVRTVGYARVSTTTQDLTLQIAQIREFCETQGLELVKQYSEQVSGATFERPAYIQMVDDFREGRLEDVYLIVVANFDRFSRARRSTAEDRLEDLNAMGISVWGIDNQQVASPADSLEERFAAGMTLFVAHHVRNLINRAMRKGYRAYLERQRRGELEPGERPIGGRTHVLTPDEIANVRRRRRYGAPKKVILRDYINRIPRFSKMKYETWLAVMKRQEIE